MQVKVTPLKIGVPFSWVSIFGWPNFYSSICFACNLYWFHFPLVSIPPFICITFKFYGCQYLVVLIHFRHFPCLQFPWVSIFFGHILFRHLLCLQFPWVSFTFFPSFSLPANFMSVNFLWSKIHTFKRLLVPFSLLPFAASPL